MNRDYLDTIRSNTENIAHYKKEAKQSKKNIIFSLGIASLMALAGGVNAYRAATIKSHPERDIFISVGKYAEHYQGENPKQVLDYLDQTLRNHIKDISFEQGNAVTTKKEDKSKTLSNIISQTKTLEDSLWYSHLYKTIEESTWGSAVTDNPKQYPEADALINHSGESLHEKALELRSLMQESGEILYHFVAPLSSIIPKAKHLDEKIWEGFPSSAASKEDVQRTRSEVNYFGEELKELGEDIPIADDYMPFAIISFFGAFLAGGLGLPDNITGYKKNMAKVRFYQKQEDESKGITVVNS